MQVPIAGLVLGTRRSGLLFGTLANVVWACTCVAVCDVSECLHCNTSLSISSKSTT